MDREKIRAIKARCDAAHGRIYESCQRDDDLQKQCGMYSQIAVAFIIDVQTLLEAITEQKSRLVDMEATKLYFEQKCETLERALLLAARFTADDARAFCVNNNEDITPENIVCNECDIGNTECHPKTGSLISSALQERSD